MDRPPDQAHPCLSFCQELAARGRRIVAVALLDFADRSKVRLRP